MYLPDLFASLPASRAERWQRIGALVAAWFGPLRAEDGVPEDAIRAAEARLGFALPAAVREAYLLFGRREEITAGVWTLTPLVQLRVRKGVLVLYSDQFYLWGIRRDDLSSDDPPVVAGSKNDKLRPALAGDDTSASRFFVFMAVLQTLESSRYHNNALPVPVDALGERLAKSFGVLDFGEVAHPVRATRLYGGHLCIVAVDPSEEEVRVGAPDLESYRAAVAALGDLPWDSPHEDADHGSVSEQNQRREAVEELFRAAREGVLSNVRRDVRDAEERRLRWARVTPDEDDTDPRLRALVTGALAPYVKLLPAVAHAFLEASTAIMLDTHPTLVAWVMAFLGTKDLDVEWTPAPHPERYEDFVQSLPPAQQEVAKALVASGMPELLEKKIGRLEGRGGVLSRGSEVDSALLHRAQKDTMKVLFRWPPRPPASPEARAYEMRRIVRQILASHFAGIAEHLATFKAAGYDDALDGYVWAELAYETFEGEGGDRHMLFKHYRSGNYELRREDAEGFRAVLDRLADAIESAADELGLPDGKAGTWGPDARPWIMAQVAKERVRRKERRKKA